MNKYTCCFCGKEFEGYGNNPYPASTQPLDVCCDKCNLEIVIPDRIKKWKLSEEKFNEKVENYVKSDIECTRKVYDCNKDCDALYEVRDNTKREVVNNFIKLFTTNVVNKVSE